MRDRASDDFEGLARGWYADPYRRWRARYWDGERWTERVANRGVEATQPVYGVDPPVAHTDEAERGLVGAAALVEALCGSELARLRAEADGWRVLAEDRQRALDALKPLIDKVRAAEGDAAIDEAKVDDRLTETETYIGLGGARAPRKYVAVPPNVREAALNEMANVEARARAKQTRLRRAKLR